MSLFGKLLEETQFPDMEVCNILEQGFPLTGSEPASPLYFKKYKPTMMTPQQLDHQAVWRRTAMMSKDMLYSESLQASDSQTESNAEVEASFLSGPFCTGRNC